MGLPIITTNWSGPSQYLTAANSFALDIDGLVAAPNNMPSGHRWAEPSVAHLRQACAPEYSRAPEYSCAPEYSRRITGTPGLAIDPQSHQSKPVCCATDALRVISPVASWSPLCDCVQLMRAVFSDRDEARRRGQQAREDMRRKYSPRVIAAQIEARIAALSKRSARMRKDDL